MSTSSTTLFTTGPNQADSEERLRQQQQHGQLPTAWATRVTLASTTVQSNRLSSLATTDDESNDDVHAQTDTEGEEAPYTLVQSRRSPRAKRRRRSGSSNHAAAAAATPSVWSSQPKQGKTISSQSNEGIC
jgi:hypothetical protein